MAISIDTEDNVAVAPGASTEVVAASVGRKSATIQLQAPGRAWIKLGGAASKNDGFAIGGWERVTISAGFQANGNNVDFYEGAVNLFWEGGTADGAPLTAANVRVIEAS